MNQTPNGHRWSDVRHRAALATEYMLEHGLAQKRSDSATLREVAAQYDIGYSSLMRVVAIALRSPILLEKIKQGQISIAQASREAGFIEYATVRLTGKGGFYGKGDKFWEALFPIKQYLRAQQANGFKFTNLPPKEATRRLQHLNELAEMLEQARVDIAERAISTSLKAPREGT
jgi:hypothetical protein